MYICVYLQMHRFYNKNYIAGIKDFSFILKHIYNRFFIEYMEYVIFIRLFLNIKLNFLTTINGLFEIKI